MVLVKLHKKDERIVVAVCDAELLGKKFEEGLSLLDLTGEFYKGEEKDDSEAGDIIRNADYVNLVGAKSVKLGIQEGIIDESRVRTIAGVPHAQAIIAHD